MTDWSAFTHARASDPQGVEAVLRVADALGMSRRGLAWSIVNESGWRPNAKNALGAEGLIQIMPMHKYGIGSSNLTRAQQAPLIKRYFSPYVGALSTRVSDIYLAIGYPKALVQGWDDSAEVSAIGNEIWRGNPGWRSEGGKGPVTVASIRAYGGEPPPGGPAEDGSDAPPVPPKRADAGGSGGGIAALLFVAALFAAAWKVRHG